MRTSTEWRRPILVSDQPGLGSILDIQDHYPGVAPGKVGRVAVDDGVMQTLPARGIRHGGLARRGVHSGQPVPPDFLRSGGIAHVDSDENVVGEAIDQGRSIGPMPAGIP